MNAHAANFFAAAASYQAELDRIDADQPVATAAASAASAASIAERDAVRAVAAAPIVTAQDAACAARLLAHLIEAEAWPDEARRLARSLAAAVERLAVRW